MQSIDKQKLILNYEILFCGKVQDLVIMRKNLRINQSKMAFYCSVSLKTIQNFENYKSKDAFLLYAYKEVFKLNNLN